MANGKFVGRRSDCKYVDAAARHKAHRERKKRLLMDLQETQKALSAYVSIFRAKAKTDPVEWGWIVGLSDVQAIRKMGEREKVSSGSPNGRVPQRRATAGHRDAPAVKL